MHVKLYEQEYLSIKEIAKEWAKEPGNISADKIEQEIWRAYWLAKFVDENNESTFMIPYEDKEYISEGELTINIIHESEEEEYNKESIKYFAIVYKEENGEIELIRFWIKYLYSLSPTPVSLERFHTHFPENQKTLEEEYNAKFITQIKNMVKQYKDAGIGCLLMEDDFIQRLIWEYKTINLRHKMVTKYVPLQRSFLFDRLYSNNLLKFTPKVLPKWSGKGEDAILMDASEEDYKMVSEQNLIFSDDDFKKFFSVDITRKQLMEPYLNPFINPIHFVDVCKKLNVNVPVFLDTANINTENNKVEDIKKKNKVGRKPGTTKKYKPIEYQVMISLPNLSHLSDYKAAQVLEEYFNEQEYSDIPVFEQIKRYVIKGRAKQIKEVQTNYEVGSK